MASIVEPPDSSTETESEPDSLKLEEMDVSGNNADALNQRIDKLCDELMKYYLQILACVSDNPDTSLNVIAQNELSLAENVSAFKRSCEDLSTLISELQELWLFGSLDTLANPSDEAAKRERTLKLAEEIQSLVKDLPTTTRNTAVESKAEAKTETDIKNGTDTLNGDSAGPNEHDFPSWTTLVANPSDWHLGLSQETPGGSSPDTLKGSPPETLRGSSPDTLRGSPDHSSGPPSPVKSLKETRGSRPHSPGHTSDVPTETSSDTSSLEKSPGAPTDGVNTTTTLAASAEQSTVNAEGLAETLEKACQL